MNQPQPLMSLLPMIVIGIPFALVAYHLAKEKNKNIALWTILALVPLVNAFAIPYLIGAQNVLLEKKIDRVVRK